MRKFIFLWVFFCFMGFAYAQKAQPLSPTPNSAPAIPEVSPTPPPSTPINQAPITLGEVEVYGQRVGIADKEISSENIQNILDTGNLGTALDELSGLETQGEGVGKTWNTLAIRGQSFRETVILVNGARVPESFNLGTLSTDDVQKMEVIEGPQALAYGSDAIGGVLNITTRTEGDDDFHLQASGGDFNTYQFRGSLPTFRLGAVKNSLSGSWYTSDGYLPQDTWVNPANGVTYNFTNEQHWDINHAASLDLDNGKLTLASGFFRHIGNAPDADNPVAAGTDQYDMDGYQDSWGVQSVLKSEHSLGDWRMEPLFYGNYSDVLRSNPIGHDPTSGQYDPFHNQYLNYGAQVYFRGTSLNHWAEPFIGFEAREECLWSGLYGVFYRNEDSLAAGGTLKFDESLHLNLANHLDYYSYYNLVDNPTGTLVWDADKNSQVHLTVGKGYQVPTYDELYLPYTDFSTLPPAHLQQIYGSKFTIYAGDKGNPNLKPEECLNSELGTDLKSGPFLFQLAGFFNYYWSLINPEVDPKDNYWTYFNLDGAFFAGAEGMLRCRFSNQASAYTSGTYVRSVDNNGNDIQGRLRAKVVMGLELKPESQWSLDMNARYVDRNQVSTVYLTDFGIQPPPTGYWDLNAKAQYTVSTHLKGFLEVENILNSQMATFQGILLPGRYFQSGLQAEF